jgi:hypothetical protein
VPRPVAVRASYNSDAGFLLRVEEAYELDMNQTEPWRKKACSLARELAQHLLTAKKPEKKSENEVEPESRGATTRGSATRGSVTRGRKE